MATLPLKSSRNEPRAVIRFLWAKGLNANEIHSEMRPVYGDKCLTRPPIHVWLRSLLAAEKALLIRNDLASMLLRRPMPGLPQLMLSYGPMGQIFEQTWTIC